MDEPRKHPLYLAILVASALGTVPFFFVGREPMEWWGVPVWLWSSVAFTLLLSCAIAWGIIFYWGDDGD